MANSKKAATRDPNAPKRNMSAYLLYQNAMRDQFKALNPGMTFGQLAKYTSAMYAEMPSSEKEVWNQRAEADKARYLHELSSYRPPPGYDAKGDAIGSNPPAGAAPTKYVAPPSMPPQPPQAARPPVKQEKGGPAPPKRNMSAYLLYQNAMREQFKRENPGMTFGQLAKYTSQMYKNLTPREKGQWEARAAQDKARYDAQVGSYAPPPQAAAPPAKAPQQKQRRTRAAKDPNAPRRASGAYVFFTSEMRPIVNHQFPGIKFVDMGRILGERWRALEPNQKKRYEDMAAEDKLRWQREMQEYQATGTYTSEGGHTRPKAVAAANATSVSKEHAPPPAHSAQPKAQAPPASHAPPQARQEYHSTQQQYAQEYQEEEDAEQHHHQQHYTQQHYQQQHQQHHQQHYHHQQQYQQHSAHAPQVSHHQYADPHQQQQYDHHYSSYY